MRTARLVVAVLAAASLVSVPVSAAAGTAPVALPVTSTVTAPVTSPAPTAGADVAQLEAVLATAAAQREEAQRAVDAARAGAVEADRALRTAEEAWVGAYRSVDDATAAHAAAARLVAELVAGEQGAREDLREQQALIDGYAVAAYKYGSSNAPAMAYEVIRVATSVDTAVVNLYRIRSVLTFQQRIVEEAATRSRQQRTSLEAARRQQTLAEQAVGAAQAELSRTRADVIAARDGESEAEAGWIAASRDRLDAEEHLADAELALATARQALAPTPTPTPAAAPTPTPTPTPLPTPTLEVTLPAPAPTPSGGPSSLPTLAPPPASDPPAVPPPPAGADVTGDPAVPPADDTVALPVMPMLEQQRALLDRREQVRVAAAAIDDARLDPPAAVCPTTVAPTYADDWHGPRSGGRRHEGTDVFAPRGTPVVAMTDGVIRNVDGADAYPTTGRDLGGLSVSYWSATGEHWYFAHFSAIPAGLTAGQRVVAGQVIGFVGTSGNAAGTPPHAHVGWYLDGVAANPYPTIAIACR